MHAQRYIPQAGDHWQRRQAALELASRHPAVHRQQPLYNKFKLDEPWDSPHNKALLKEMPSTYLCPSRTDAEPSTTTYRVLTGKGALFESDKNIRLADVTDGTSNTVMVVESDGASALDQARRRARV